MVQALATPANTATRSIGASSAGGQNISSYSLLVGFEHGTHRLSYEGIVALRHLAAALLDPRLAEAQFQIVGHAYSPGSPQYSLPLSARRAQAVAAHLTTFYLVDPARLSTVGAGSQHLLDPANFNSPINQRIEIVKTAG